MFPTSEEGQSPAVSCRAAHAPDMDFLGAHIEKHLIWTFKLKQIFAFNLGKSRARLGIEDINFFFYVLKHKNVKISNSILSWLFPRLISSSASQHFHFVVANLVWKARAVVAPRLCGSPVGGAGGGRQAGGVRQVCHRKAYQYIMPPKA